jgi:unsaturated rhamnogalacturonyl hydrolase
VNLQKCQDRIRRISSSKSFRSAARSVTLIIFPLLSTNAQTPPETEHVLRQVADRVIANSSFQFEDRRSGLFFPSASLAPAGADLRLASPYNDWRYWNGVLGIAMARLGVDLEDTAYTLFPSRNVAFVFDNYRYFERRYAGQNKWDYPFGQFFVLEELDDCGAMGASTIEVNQTNHREEYRAYIDRASKHMRMKQSRMDDGTFVRAFPRKWTLWADDLYMSVAFLARRGGLPGGAGDWDDAARQVIKFHSYLFDDEKGLMHHCWYSDTKLKGVACWGRANGWALLAQVDLLDRLPDNYPERDTLLTLLRRHVSGVAQYQSESGLWHQLLDREDSYLETSCSAMITYAIARAVNRGYIEPRYSSIVRKGWRGVVSKIRPDGQIEGICTGTSVSDNLDDYYHRPTPLNDVHGIGIVLLAGTEMLKLRRQ